MNTTEDTEGSGTGISRDGPEYRCKNGSCDAFKPKTKVVESERKTMYNCPLCNRALAIDWHTEDDE